MSFRQERESIVGLEQKRIKDKARLHYVLLRLTYPKFFTEIFPYKELYSAIHGKSLEKDFKEKISSFQRKILGKHLDAIIYYFSDGDCFLVKLMSKEGEILWDCIKT